MAVLFIWLGAMLTIGGLLYLVQQTIWQGPLSGPFRNRSSSTLEPRVAGFASAKFWPGVALVVLGLLLILAGAHLTNPELPPA